MVQPAQIGALIDYLELRPELALGHMTRTMEGRSLAKILWAECATIVNAASEDGAQKTASGWRVFYNEYKSRVLKKFKALKAGGRVPGDGKPRVTHLTPLQRRLYDVVGRDGGESMQRVLDNPLIKTEYIKRNVKQEMKIAHQHERTDKEEYNETSGDKWCPKVDNTIMEIVEVTPLHVSSDNNSCASGESYFDDTPCPKKKKLVNYQDLYFKRKCQNAVLERRKLNQDIRLRQKEHNIVVKLHHTRLMFMRKEHEEKMKRFQFID